MQQRYYNDNGTTQHVAGGFHVSLCLRDFRVGAERNPPKLTVPELTPPKLTPPKLVMPEALQTLPEMAWCATADGKAFVVNARWRAITGSRDGIHLQADWLQGAHGDDRDALVERWTASVCSLAPFEMMFRLRHADGHFGWVMARAVAVPGTEPADLRWIGTAADIDALKAGEDRVGLVANELAHRIGNIFAVVGSVLAMAARERPEAEEFSRSAHARIEALASAHAFIWPPLLGGEAPPQHAQSLIAGLLLPYGDGGGAQITLSGDDLAIGGSTATCMALIVHELATNAVKYGALSSGCGHVAVHLRQSATQLTLIWSETGGPSIGQPPVDAGFGTALLERIVKLGQASRVRRWWRTQGLTVAIRFNLAPQSRSAPTALAP